jgi:hypothetical protein
MIKIKKCYKGCYDVFFNNKNIFEIIDANSEGKIVNYSLWNVIENNMGFTDSNNYQSFNSFKEAKEYVKKYAEEAYNNCLKYEKIVKKIA